jgi:hypothetical protein
MTSCIRRLMMVVLAFLSLLATAWAADELDLKPLIAEALKNNREVLAAEARVIAAGTGSSRQKGCPIPCSPWAIRMRDLPNNGTKTAWMPSGSYPLPRPFPSLESGA